MCHAAYDASLQLARTGKYLMQEALAVRGRALAGRAAGGAGAGGHWDEMTGKERLMEVVARMGAAEDRPALAKALRS